MDQVEEIKERLDLMEVVRGYIKLKKSGANYKALCPFHDDKKASLFVSPTKQIWKCFGCDLGGDVFDFVEEIEGVGFGEALEILAEKAGVKLKRVSPEKRSKKKRLYEVADLACEFFEKQLHQSRAGGRAREYLTEKRGVNGDSIEKWRLGYAPGKWRSLTRFLSSSGYSREEIRKVGVGVRNEKGHFYDRFRGRIIFPVFDLHSRVIGFGGRVFKEREREGVAKYLNTTNTPLYDKSKILYGLGKSKVKLRRRDGCIVAEGYTDVILSHQAGVENIVASSGTALTPFHLKVLGRYTNNLHFAFDMDAAGRSATRRGISLAQEKGFDIHVILMPGGHDPADIVARDPERWREMVEERRDVLDFYFETTFERFDAQDPKEKKEIARRLLPVVKRLPNEIERFHWVQELASRLGVTEESVQREMRKIESPEEKPVPVEREKERRQDKPRLLENQLLSFLLQNPESAELISSEHLEYLSAEGAEVLSAIKEEGSNPEGLRPGLSRRIEMASLRVEVEGSVDDVEKEIQNCLEAIRRWRLKKKMRSITRRLKKAEEGGEAEKIKMLTEKFNNLSKKMEP